MFPLRRKKTHRTVLVKNTQVCVFYLKKHTELCTFALSIFLLKLS